MTGNCWEMIIHRLKLNTCKMLKVHRVYMKSIEKFLCVLLFLGGHLVLLIKSLLYEYSTLLTAISVLIIIDYFFNY